MTLARSLTRRRALSGLLAGTAALYVAPGLAQEGSPSLPQNDAPADFDQAVERARGLAPLETLIVAQHGETVIEEGFRGHSTTAPTNIKSASKSVISALVGIAIDEGVLEGPDQTIAPLLANDLPDDPDPRLREITIGNLLSMQAGLERTSGGNYGRWIASANWVRFALSRPFDDEPGGAMLYSTGNSHLLSAILSRRSGRSTLDLARDWLPESVRIADWERDPQGIYLGGNQMAMSPRSLLVFGEIYRRGGQDADGNRIIPRDWIEKSWKPRTRSRFTGVAYGYGWFLDRFAGHAVRYGWGYGGQMIYVVPDLALTVAITSDETHPSGRGGYVRELHRLVSEAIIPAAEARQAETL
ncbi:serine hydrolase domain-containing protein [Consotaella aegiceratis]|uniref:serine hydrolase domain-containing protein n=1 Tax=Consotaella aegiceratis TaxID=3097961 RepID=UPI002F3EA92A